MSVKDAKNTLEVILNSKATSLDDINNFISKLTEDKELNTTELSDLLSKTTPDGLDLGHLIFKVKGNFAKRNGTVSNFLNLLKKAQLPLTVFEQKVTATTTTPSLAQLIAKHCNNSPIQDMLHLLKDHYYNPFNDTTLDNILLLLNQKRQSNLATSSRSSIETDRSFFEEIAHRNLLIDMSPIIEMITQSLNHNGIYQEDIKNHPEKFVSAVHQQEVRTYREPYIGKVSHWLTLFLQCYWPTNFKLLAFVSKWCKNLSRGLSHYGDQTLTINQFTSVTELSLLRTCLNSYKSGAYTACDFPERLKTVRIVGSIENASLTHEDSVLLGAVTDIFTHIRTLEFEKSELSQDFICLLTKARTQAAEHYYKVNKISMTTVPIEKLILDQNTRKYLPTGFPTSDPTVEELAISNSVMHADVFKEEAFLKFLTSMPKLKTLTLANLHFPNRNMRLSTIDQALRKPGLTSLTLDFPLDDKDLLHIIKLLNYNQSLTTLSLPQGCFSTSTLAKLAETLRSSNHTLHTLTLAKGAVMPTQLVAALRHNNERAAITDIQRRIQNIIDCVNRFLSPANDITQRDEILSLWHNVAWSVAEIDAIIKIEVAPSAVTLKLCEDLAISGSRLMLKIASLTMRTPSYLYMNHVVPLAGLFQYLTSLSVKSEFAKNIYAFCTKYYEMPAVFTDDTQFNDNLARGLIDIAQKNLNRFSANYDGGQNAPASEILYTLRNNEIDFLLRVLTLFPAEPNLLYHEVNSLIFTLLKFKILALLDKSTDNDAVKLSRKITDIKTTEIKHLFAHLNEFLSDIGDTEHLIMLTSKLFAEVRKDFFGSATTADPHAELITNLKTMRAEVQRIFNARACSVISAPPPFIQSKNISEQAKVVSATNTTSTNQSAAPTVPPSLPRSAEVDVYEATATTSLSSAINPKPITVPIPPTTTFNYYTNTPSLPLRAAIDYFADAPSLPASSAIDYYADAPSLPACAAIDYNADAPSLPACAAIDYSESTSHISMGPEISYHESTQTLHARTAVNSEVTPLIPPYASNPMPTHDSALASAASSLLRPPSPVAALSLSAPLLPTRYVSPSTISAINVADSAKLANTDAVVPSNSSQTKISDAHLQDPPLENPQSPRNEQNVNIRDALRFTTFASDLVRFVDPIFPAVPTYQPMEATTNRQESRNSNMANDEPHQKARRALPG